MFEGGLEALGPRGRSALRILLNSEPEEFKAKLEELGFVAIGGFNLNREPMTAVVGDPNFKQIGAISETDKNIRIPKQAGQPLTMQASEQNNGVREENPAVNTSQENIQPRPNVPGLEL